MEIMKVKTFDIIISDYVMPGKDGLQFLKELRDSGNSIPFIMFTGRGREEVAIKALNLGADQYLNKFGAPETVYGELAYDIRKSVEARKAETALQESEERFRSIVENSHDGIVMIDNKFMITYANDEASHIIGYSKEEIVGHSFMKFLSEESKNLVKDRYLRRQKGERVTSTYEFKVVRKDGQERDVEIKSTVMRDSRGMMQTVAQLLDITERKKAEEKLRDSEAKWRSMTQNSPDHIILLDRDANILFINYTVPDLTKEQVIGTPIYNYVPEKFIQDMSECFERVLKTGEPDQYDVEYYATDGNIRFFENRVGPVERSGEIVGLTVSARDVTQRKRMEDAIKQSEEKYRSIVELAPDSIMTFDLKGVITSCNTASTKLSGYSEDELVGKHFSKMGPIRARDIPKFLKMLPSTIREKAPKTFEITFQHKNGTLRQGEVHISLMKVGDKTLGLQAVMRDITERKKVEEERNRLLHNLGERVKELRCLYDISKLVEKPRIMLDEILQGTVKLLPRAWQYPDVACARIIFENRQFKTENFKETRWKQQADINVHGKRAGNVEVHYLEEKPILNKGPFLKEERNMIDAIAQRLGREIERRTMEKALHESEKKHRTLLETTNVMVQSVNAEGKFVYVNKEWKRKMGFTDKDLEKMTLMDVIRKDHKKYCMDVFKEVVKGKSVSNIETVFVTKDRREIAVSGNVQSTTKNGEFVSTVGFFSDITERKHAEEKLRNSEERLKILFEFAPDAYYLNDLTGNFIDGNKAAEELTGYNRNELIGKTFLKLGLLRRRQIPKAAKLLAKNALGKPTGPDEFVLNRKDGAQVSVEIRTFPVKIKGQTLVLGIAHDVTERKKTLEKLKMMNEKLGVVGKLTRHDVCNKLSAVTNNVYLAKQRLSSDSEALKYLGDVESAVRQTGRIFDFTRTYEKLGMEELAYTDVEKTLKEATTLFSNLHSAKILNDCHGLTVLADSLLRQLFYNLIDNSLKHGEKVSRIRAYYEEAGKDKMKLVYEDDGVGIPKAEKEKIFREGYGKDSGYGLYLIRKMCEVYGWNIRETGKHGKGVQFTITIPKMNKSGKMTYQLH